MAIICGVVETARELGFPEASQRKAAIAYEKAFSGLDAIWRASAKIGFGTDLLGTLHVMECREFTMRREAFPQLETLRQATSIFAEMMMQKGRLGFVGADAHAGVLVVDGDPLGDISLFAADGKNLGVIKHRYLLQVVGDFYTSRDYVSQLRINPLFLSGCTVLASHFLVRTNPPAIEGGIK